MIHEFDKARMKAALEALGVSHSDVLPDYSQPTILTSYVEVEVNVDLQELRATATDALPAFLLTRLYDRLSLDLSRTEKP